MPKNRLALIKIIDQQPQHCIEDKHGQKNSQCTDTGRPHHIFIFDQKATHFFQCKVPLLHCNSATS